jgi:hypothetical protein
MSDEWLMFGGSATDEGNSVVLTAAIGGGALKAKKEDVKIDGQVVYVKKNVKVDVVKNPVVHVRPKNQTEADYECNKWACIGLILYCCDDGHTRGGCIGISGC